jgi:hypothetical protein
VVHRAAGDPRELDDLLTADRCEAILGEASARRRDEGAAGRGAALGLAAPGRIVALDGAAPF